MRCIALALTAVSLVACGTAAAGAPAPLFQHGEIALGADEEVRVRSGLVQAQLAPDVVLSASAGAAFRLGPGAEIAGEREITVSDGIVRVIHLQSNTMRELQSGRYRIDFTQGMTVLAVPDAMNESRLIQDHRAGIHLADGAMLRQNEALIIPTAELVRAIFGFFRGVAR